MTEPQPIPRVRECTAPGCRFRYPIPDPAADRPLCPLCASPTRVAHAWRGGQPEPPVPPKPVAPIRPVEAFLDNLRSTYNVGSILRTADGAGIRHVHLAGITPQPDNPKVVKTALGAQTLVPWTYHRNGVDAVAALRTQGKQIWVLEVSHAAMLLPLAVDSWPVLPGPGAEPVPVVLVVGNEVAGIDPSIVLMADRVLALPMCGSKRSLNVAVAFGVAAYFLIHG